MIILASANSDSLMHYQSALRSTDFSNCIHTFPALKKNQSQFDHPLILMDYELPGFMGAQSIHELLALNQKTTIIVIGPALTDEIEWALFKAGIKGYCQNTINTVQLDKVIQTVQRGELWIRRALTHRVLKELIKTTYEKQRIEQFTRNAMASLTHREHEIALLVAEGESNKAIAHRLAITERTVKAHLTGIFKKLQVSDRVKVALIIKDVMHSP